MDWELLRELLADNPYVQGNSMSIDATIETIKQWYEEQK